jgi:hypothetical protein
MLHYFQQPLVGPGISTHLHNILLWSSASFTFNNMKWKIQVYMFVICLNK